MKLLNKTSKYYVIATLIVFFIGCIVFYFAVKTFVNKDIISKMYEEKAKLETKIAQLDSISNTFFSTGDDVIIKKIPVKQVNSSISIRDTVLYDEKEENEEMPSKSITFYANSKFYTYQITIIKSLVEDDDLIEAIVIALITLIGLFLISLYFINRSISRAIWSPFYESLDTIKKFDIEDIQPIILHHSDINEFNELNDTIARMTDKIQHDYRSLKEFTENASHEIQTPLAIIQNKLELLIQNENLKEEEMAQLQSVYNASNRLSKLNQSLILLTKIDNHQFGQKEKINFSKLVNKHVANYTELIDAKNLKLKSYIQEGVTLTINAALADILVSNLFTNAIKHNIVNGEIILELTATHFLISNTGKALQGNPSEFFQRFKKDNQTSESLGLGLSIVKRICDSEHIKISYTHSLQYHLIDLEFERAS